MSFNVNLKVMGTAIMIYNHNRKSIKRFIEK